MEVLIIQIKMINAPNVFSLIQGHNCTSLKNLSRLGVPVFCIFWAAQVEAFSFFYCGREH